MIDFSISGVTRKRLAYVLGQTWNMLIGGVRPCARTREPSAAPPSGSGSHGHREIALAEQARNPDAAYPVRHIPGAASSGRRTPHPAVSARSAAGRASRQTG